MSQIQKHPYNEKIVGKVMKFAVSLRANKFFLIEIQLWENHIFLH